MKSTESKEEIESIGNAKNTSTQPNATKAEEKRQEETEENYWRSDLLEWASNTNKAIRN